ncbi:sialidase-3-like [Zootoca vivipara]|uniref:sialidase-3-like n=1 Tax=Zootoca vivipara TaxID=8524 RepID=UPI00159275CE|nr:sialidase-3-like [Zootoca vivipara]XP_034971904.1 sialidase-3-like [Zootoca vivipara]
MLGLYALRGIRCANISACPENMAEAQAGSGKVTLFSQKKRGGLTYRIPALLYLPSESTFLAFAEERSSPRDEDAKFLVMRRGRKEGTSVQWGPQEPLETAVLPNHRTMNPCPVFERKSGALFLFFICVEKYITERHQISTGRNAARLCYVSSPDGGRTWSQATDLTEAVIGGELTNWATFAVGPGHGVQLSSGRLVIPAYAYYIHKRLFGHPLECWIKPHCFTFYSDDGGQSWLRSPLLEALLTSECQVAELSRSDKSRVLYCNARSLHNYRVGALCTDNGHQFVSPSLCEELCESPHGCQGSVVSFSPQLEPLDLGRKKDGAKSSPSLDPSSAPLKSAQSWLIFSHPTKRHKRVDLGIYLNTSPLEKGCWKAPWVLNKGPSGYSDLAVCEEGESVMFGCLFECGVSCECEEIAFQLFTAVELLRNMRESCCGSSPPSEA